MQSFVTLIAILFSTAIYFYPTAATIVWDGGGATNNWSEPANWSSDTVPAAGDTVVFDGTSSKNAIIDVDVAPSILNLNTGYTGTVSMGAGRNVTTGSMSVNAGIFNGGDGTLDVTGTMAVSGTGTFNAPTGTMILRSSFSVFRPQGAVFNANGGTIELRGTAHSIFIDGSGGQSITLNNLRIELVNNASAINFDANGGLDGTIVDGTLTLANGVIGSGYFIANGPVDYQPTFDGGGGSLASINFAGNSTRTIQLPSGTPMIGFTTVSGPNTTVEITGNNPTTFEQRIDVQGGIFTNGASDVTVTGTILGNILQSGGTFNAGSGTTITAASFQQTGGTFNGQSAAAMDLNSFAISGTATFNAPSGSVFLTSFSKFGAGVTFNTNNGTFVFHGTNNSIAVDGTIGAAIVFHNLTLNSSQDNGGLSMDANGGLDAPYSTGTVRLQNGRLQNSLIYYTGNIEVDAGFDGGPGALWAYGGGQQTYTGSGGTLPTGDFTVAKSGGAYTLLSDLTLGTSQTLAINGSVVDMGTNSSITAGTVNIDATGFLRNTGIGDITLGNSLDNSGKISIVSDCPANDEVLVRSNVSGATRTWNGAGRFIIVNADIQDMAGSASVTAFSSTDSGNNGANWTFDPNCPVPLSISPSSTVKYIGETQTFTASGGFTPYTYSVQANNSGGSINPSTGLYTAGNTFNVTDTIRVTDAAGQSEDASVLVSAGPPTQIQFSTQPTNTTAGQAITPAIVVSILDSAGNVVIAANGPVTLSLANNPAGGTLSGTLTTNAVNGVATFNDVSIAKAGNGYTLSAAVSGLPNANSNSFNITPGAPSQLAFSTQPPNGAAHLNLSTAFAVAVRDAFGNNVPNATNPVTVSIANNPSGGTISGDLTRFPNPTSGIALFSAVKIDQPGNGYTLSATSPGLAGATSAPFDLVSPFVVTSSASDGIGTLYTALSVANIVPGTQTISFNIPGTGPFTVSPTLPLETVRDSVVIDATTQPGYAGTPLVALNCLSYPTGSIPAAFRLTASNNLIKGLAIGNCSYAGIQILAGSNGNTIQSNHIGTNPAGTSAAPNGHGIMLGGANNLIGGSTAATRNVISGNNVVGISIIGGASGNMVRGNVVGLAANIATPIPNGAGISAASANNQIGGTAGGEGNVISGNAGPGVLIGGSSGNSVRGNSIFGNGALGIDLVTTGVTPNDTCDGDGSANGLQNFPVLTSFTTLGGTTTVTGTLNSKPNANYTLDFYTSDSPDPSGFGEGKTWIGSLPVSTGANCELTTATFTFNAPAVPPTARFVTATATDANGSTSEFSAIAGATVTIAGTMLDGSNAPIAGATIQLRNTVSGPILRTTISGSDGRFAFAGLAPDANYHLFAYKANHVFTPSTKTYNALATSVDETWAGAINYLAITGRVTSNGSAVGGVTMTLSGAANRTATTDSAGNYSFTNLLGGLYTITPSKTNFTFSPGSQTISLSVNTPVNFTATDLIGTLTGKILYKSLDGELRLANANGSGEVVLRTDTSMPNPSFIQSYAISQDGSKIAFRANSQIRQMNADGSNETVILSNAASPVFDIDWSKDNSTIAFVTSTDRDRIYKLGANGSGFSLVSPSNSYSRYPSWSPNGGSIVYYENSGGGFNGLFTIDPNGSGRTQIVAGSKLTPSLAPNNSKIAFAEGGFLKTILSNGTGEVALSSLSGSVSRTDWAPNGTRILFSGGYPTYVIRSVDATDGSAGFDHANGYVATWGSNITAVTPPGSQVTVGSGRVSVTFGSVAARGDAAGSGGSTTVELVRPEAVGDAPAGYAFSEFAYRIETDATYTGPVTFCIDVPADRYLTAQQFASLRILHLDGGVFFDRTDLPTDFANRRACGTTTTVGQFVLAELIDPAMPSIIGQIVNANGDPIVDHTVILSGAEERFVKTDLAGQFVFRNLDAGADYSVAPNANGFVFDFASRSFPAIAGENIAVFTGSAQTFTISGGIRDGNGAPVQNVRVFLTGSAYREAVTDANGEYVFEGIAANESVDVRPDRSSLPSLTTLVPSPESYTIDQIGSDLPGLDFTLTAPTAAGVSVGGRITGPDGTGVPRVRVTITDGSNPQPMTAITNGFGYYYFNGVPAGQTYVITVSSKRHSFDPPARLINVFEDVFDADFIAFENP